MKLNKRNITNIVQYKLKLNCWFYKIYNWYINILSPEAMKFFLLFNTFKVYCKCTSKCTIILRMMQ